MNAYLDVFMVHWLVAEAKIVVDLHLHDRVTA